MATTGAFESGGIRVAITLGGATAGDMVAIANPEGVDLIITKAIVNVTTASTGASTVDVGVAANATTSADTLIDGLSLATAGAWSTPGSNGRPAIVWGANQYVTMSEASGDVAGAVGELILQYITR